MAKKESFQSVLQQFNELFADISKKDFKPVYLLMGEEPYFVDLLSEAIIKNALDDSERDFNETIVYGSDGNVTAEAVISMARRFPMMSQRSLVVIKEAQLMDKIDELKHYFTAIVPSTVFVICFTGKSMDKRLTLYNSIKKHGVIFESIAIPEGDVPNWIKQSLTAKKLKIENSAAILMAEHTGTDLRKIALECDKLGNAIEEGGSITEDDIEKHVGISKEYNAFQLTKALSYRDNIKAFKIAMVFGDTPKKYPIQMTIGSLFYFFNNLMNYHYVLFSDPRATPDRIKKEIGVWYLQEYETAARNYNIKKTAIIIALLEQFDYMTKSNAGGGASEKDLIVELISKILS